MPALHVHLEEGFASDQITMRLGDRTAFDEGGITTRNQIGLARIVDIDAPSNPTTLRIEVPTRNASTSLTVDASRTPYVRVSLDGGSQLRAEATTDEPKHA